MVLDYMYLQSASGLGSHLSICRHLHGLSQMCDVITSATGQGCLVESITLIAVSKSGFMRYLKNDYHFIVSFNADISILLIFYWTAH